MRTDDIPLSWEIGFDFQGTHYVYITAPREGLTNLSLGRLRMDLCQRYYLKKDLKKFDLMGRLSHRKSWSNQQMPITDYYYEMCHRGKLFGWLYLRHLPPLTAHPL